MVKGSVVANSPLLYALIVVGLGIIIAYAIMSVKKASARCAELGIGSDVIKNVVKSTVVSSIVPSLAILLGFITLTVSLGAALPWWRLSVIGSLSYEAMAASYAANGLGVQLSDVLTSDATVFGAIMIVMSIGICSGPIMVTLLAKRYSTGIMQAKTGKSEFGQIMAGCFMLAMFCVYIPIMVFTDLPTTMICGTIAKKHPVLNDFTMAIAMIVAMASSVLWVQVFA